MESSCHPGGPDSWPEGYAVVSADGTQRGYVRFPEPFLVMDIVDDLALGVVKDDFDVQAVALYRFYFPGGSGAG